MASRTETDYLAWYDIPDVVADDLTVRLDRPVVPRAETERDRLVPLGRFNGRMALLRQTPGTAAACERPRATFASSLLPGTTVEHEHELRVYASDEALRFGARVAADAAVDLGFRQFGIRADRDAILSDIDINRLRGCYLDQLRAEQVAPSDAYALALSTEVERAITRAFEQGVGFEQRRQMFLRALDPRLSSPSGDLSVNPPPGLLSKKAPPRPTVIWGGMSAPKF